MSHSFFRNRAGTDQAVFGLEEDFDILRYETGDFGRDTYAEVDGIPVFNSLAIRLAMMVCASMSVTRS